VPNSAQAVFILSKSLAEFAAAAANRITFIFSGGVYVGENPVSLQTCEMFAIGGL
jgi:hypothetical protein